MDSHLVVGGRERCGLAGRGIPPIRRTGRRFAASSQELKSMVMVRLNHVTTRFDPRHYQARIDVPRLGPQPRFREPRKHWVIATILTHGFSNTGRPHPT